VSSLRDRLNAMQPEPSAVREPETAGIPIDAVTPGSVRQTVRGSHFVVETAVPDPTMGSFQNRHELLPTILGHEVTFPDKTRASDILFLDTETTGIDRGTGTHVFLVGIGYFKGTNFLVEQHFLRDLHEEASLLCELDQLIREFAVLVTFNGRGFDWPLLNNRFILHGYRDTPELAHWDLLTSSRRVWRNRLRDCSLGSLERNLLGVERYGDVPGYLIPGLYFDYLRSRDARPLRPVFSHNQEDIVSLARLADLLLTTEQDPTSALAHPIDQLSFGLFLLSQGETTRAEHLIRLNLEHPSIDIDLRFRAFKSLANHHKRRSRWHESIELWKSMLRQRWASAEQALYPLVELAKVYEHKLRDYGLAAHYVEQGLNLVNLKGWAGERSALMHRYARLKRRARNERSSGIRGSGKDRGVHD
jgi:uncharacterized protein